MRSQQIEVLQTLGYPLYVRKSLLEAQAKQQAAQNQSTTASVEAVRARAHQVTQKSRVQIPEERGETSTWVRLSIGILASNEALAVFDCRRNNPDAHRALIENMLVKCGCRIHELPFAHFTWPVVENPNVQQGEQDAMRALSALQNQSCAVKDGAWLLIVGTMAQQFFDASAFGDKVLYLPYTATQMIEQPNLRKKTWDSLAPLRSDITGSS